MDTVRLGFVPIAVSLPYSCLFSEPPHERRGHTKTSSPSGQRAGKSCETYDGISRLIGVLYSRPVTIQFSEPAKAWADGSLRSLLAPLSRIDVLAIDDGVMGSIIRGRAS